MDVKKIRSEIPACSRTYLNTGGTGPSPRPVSEEMIANYSFMQENGPDAPGVKDEVRNRAETTRSRLAALLGVSPDELAFMRSISEGMSTVAYGLSFQPGDEVIVSDEENPSGLLVFLQLGLRQGVVVRKLSLAHDAGLILDRLAGLIGPRTRLVAVSHVTCETGLRLPAAEICRLAHVCGVPVLFDGAQSVGQFPVNLAGIGADYYAFTGHKWLLGGLGVAALYVRREHQADLAVSWTGASAVEDLGRDTYEFRFLPSARRYEFGGRQWPLYVAWGRAVEYVGQIGLAEIEVRVRAMAGRLRAELAAIPGVRVLTPHDPALSTGIVTFSVAGLSGKEVADSLWSGPRILGRAALERTATRVSVAFFTDDAELEALLQSVRALAHVAAR